MIFERANSLLHSDSLPNINKKSYMAEDSSHKVNSRQSILVLPSMNRTEKRMSMNTFATQPNTINYDTPKSIINELGIPIT